MNNFLKELTQLDSIQDVILLSKKGEPLFSGLPITDNTSIGHINQWFKAIKEIDTPEISEFLFENGRYFIRKTAIGYLIVGMRNDTDLETIKNASTTISKQFEDAEFLKKALLWMLKESNDLIKPNLIKALAPMADKEIAISLILLLEKEQDFKPHVREQLQLFICEALGYCKTREAIAPLNRFLARHTRTPKTPLHEEISEAITLSIKQLEQEAKDTAPPESPQPKSESTAKQQQTPLKQTSQEATNQISPPSLRHLPEIAEISTFIDMGDTSKAITTITQLIKKQAEKKEFKTAETLRNWLIQFAPMALTDIVQAAEIIDKEKRSSIDTYHLEIWRDLVTLLTVDEFSALYHAMKLHSYPNGEMIVKQGANKAMLLFINSGRVQVQITHGGSTLPLSIKKAGELSGAETIFGASVWTVSVKSLGTELFVLSRQALNELSEEHPSLNAKLLHFCSQVQSTSSQLKKFRKNRRRHERKRLIERISFVVLNSEGKTISPTAKGDMIDISLGGIAFAIHASQKKNAMWFFGKKLEVNITTKTSSVTLIRQGFVRAVKDFNPMANSYSLHLQFDRMLTSSELQKLILAIEKESE